MGKNQGFLSRHNAQKQKQYERVPVCQYGPEIVNESIQRWNGYSKAEQVRILEESGQIYSDLVAAIEARKSPHSPDVQANPGAAGTTISITSTSRRWKSCADWASCTTRTQLS